VVGLCHWKNPNEAFSNWRYQHGKKFIWQRLKRQLLEVWEEMKEVGMVSKSRLRSVHPYFDGKL
tara:strand:- start:102 stop:293 length:192 start_codon:yes stop_codon:yes gene_type:complete